MNQQVLDMGFQSINIRQYAISEHFQIPLHRLCTDFWGHVEITATEFQ